MITPKWFYANHIVPNPGKYHHILKENKSYYDNGVELKNINDKKLLKTPINKNVQIKSMFANGSEKIGYLARINNILINTEIFLLANSVAKS